MAQSDRRSWPDASQVIQVVRGSSSVEEACARVSQLRNVPATSPNALQQHWAKYIRTAGHGAFGQELGAEVKRSLPNGASASPLPEVEGYWISEDAPRDMLIIPDIHFPYHDEAAVSAVLEYARDVRPHKVVQIGDALDFYGVSAYSKTPTRQGPEHSLYAEVRSALPFWEELLRVAGSVEYLPGNHEERLQRNVIQAYAALHGHPALDLRSILQLPEAIVAHGYGAKVRVGNLVLTHGDKLRRGQFTPKYAAANVLSKYPNLNLVAGHTHKIDVARHTVYHEDGPHTYAMRYIGWIGDAAQIEYESDPSYQQGFAHVEFWKVGSKVRHSFHMMELVNGQFTARGKVYGKRRRARK